MGDSCWEEQEERKEMKSVIGEKRWAHKKVKKREAGEGGSEQVKKDVKDWTVVSRSKKQKKMIQVYVKLNGGKLVPTEVNLRDDEVENVVRQIPSSEDMYVTMQGRLVKRSEGLESCGVTDGCTIQISSRIRRGGRHKNKKREESAKTERMEHRVDQQDDEVGGVVMDSAHKDAVIQMIEQDEVYRKIVDEVSGGNDFEEEWKVQEYMRINRETLGWTQEQADMMGCGIRWAVEARRKGRGAEKEQRRREEPLEEMRVESTDELEVTS